jgi:hypothetical protein
MTSGWKIFPHGNVMMKKAPARFICDVYSSTSNVFLYEMIYMCKIKKEKEISLQIVNKFYLKIDVPM